MSIPPQLHDNYVEGQTVSAAEYDALVRILSSQVQGALEAAGKGIISGLVVSAGSGLNVNVTAGNGVLDSTKGFCLLTTDGAPGTVALPANSTRYIWLAAQWHVDPGDEDSFETGFSALLADPSSTGVADALLLASVVTGPSSVTTVNDLRSLLSAAQLAALAVRVTVLEAEEIDHESRIGALEGDVGGGSVTYIGPATFKAGSAETTEQAIDRKDAALQTALEAEIAAIAGGETAATLYTPWNEDADAHFQHLCHYIRRVDAFGWQRVPGAIIIDGVCGEGSNSSPDYIDHVNSTW